MGCVKTIIIASFLFTVAGGASITSKERGKGKMREDRLNYAATENKLKYIGQYLKEFGYLDDKVKLGGLRDEEIATLLNKPLKKYQRFNDLPVTGEDYCFLFSDKIGN